MIDSLRMTAPLHDHYCTDYSFLALASAVVLSKVGMFSKPFMIWLTSDKKEIQNTFYFTITQTSSRLLVVVLLCPFYP